MSADREDDVFASELNFFGRATNAMPLKGNRTESVFTVKATTEEALSLSSYKSPPPFITGQPQGQRSFSGLCLRQLENGTFKMRVAKVVKAYE